MSPFKNEVKIIESDHFADDVTQILKQSPSNKILVICSKRFVQTDQFKKLKQSIGEFATYTDIEINPSVVRCQEAIKSAAKINPQVIIAIGGGSVMDLAKAVRMGLYKDSSSFEDLLSIQGVKKNKPLFIAIPTTHGTGSEVVMWATVWDKVNKKKYSISESDNYPDYAIYDINLVKSLPVDQSIITTLDALSHAFEALWNKNANPTSDDYAIKAIKLIMENLPRITDSVPDDARTNLFKACQLAGLAFSNTKTAAAHSISYPLTSYFDVPHGIACSLSLYSLMKINQKAIESKLETLLKKLNFKDIDELWQRVLQSVKGKIPYRLEEFGIKKKDLEWLNDLCFTKDRMENNIVKLDKNDVSMILEEIY